MVDFTFPSPYVPGGTSNTLPEVPFATDLLVERVDSTSYVAGVYTEGPTRTFTIRANVQPATLRDLSFYEQSLEAGQRTGELIRIYTGSTLNVPVENEPSSPASDKVHWEGNVYRVVRRAKWHSGIISHNKYFAVLEAT